MGLGLDGAVGWVEVGKPMCLCWAGIAMCSVALRLVLWLDYCGQWVGVFGLGDYASPCLRPR